MLGCQHPIILGAIAAGVLPAGEVSGLVTHIPTAKELIDEIVNT